MTKEVFQLEVQITTTPALTGLQNLNKELAKTKQAAGDVGKDNKLAPLKTSTDLLTTSMKGLGTVIAGIGFIKMATDAIGIIANFQTLSVTLETVSGSAARASAQMDIIRNVSKATGFSIAEMASSAINLSTNGITPTAERLKLFADVASVTSNKVQSLTAISNLFARNIQGGLGLEDLNILANAGVPVFDILAKKLNVTRGQIAQLGQSAEGAGIILRTLEGELSQRFGGQSAKQLETINGQFSVLKNNLTGLAISAGDAGVTKGLTDLLKVLNEVVVSSDGTSRSIGQTLGSALSGIATAINSVSNLLKFLSDNLKIILTVLGLVAAAFFIPEIIAFGGAIMTLFRGIGLVVNSFAELTAGMGFLRGAMIVLQEVFRRLGAIFAEFGGAKIYDWVVKAGEAVHAYLPAWVQWALAITGVGYAIDTLSSKPAPKLGWDTPGPNKSSAYDFKGDGRASISSFQGRNAEQDVKDQQRAADLATGRTVTADKILRGLREETNLIGLNRAAQEAQTKILELHNSMKDKLIAAGKTEADAEAQVSDQLKNQAEGIAQVAAIRAASASKYIKERQFQYEQEYKETTAQMNLLLLNGQELERQTQLHAKIVELEKQGPVTELDKLKILSNIDDLLTNKQLKFMRDYSTEAKFQLSLIGLSTNEAEKQSLLRQALIDMGKRDNATEQEKLDILKEIDKLQGAKTNQYLKDNLEGINKEIEYLKLGNMEREKRNALDSAATGAGFKNAAEFSKARPEDAAAIRTATGEKVLTGINVEAQKQIDNLKEESMLLSILDEQDRQRLKNQLDIYKAIDPEGRGANITSEMKNQIGTLQATIEAQNKLIEVNKKISDSFTTLGDAVTKWKLGASGGIEQVRLELIKLIALQALKSFTGGSTNGLVGSFINGIIGGLSGKAEGGPVQAGTSYIVGEKRPEIFTPTQNGYIIPNTSMVNTSNGQTSNVTISPNLIIHGGVNGQRELDIAFEQFAGAMAKETQKFIIQQTGQGGIVRAR